MNEEKFNIKDKQTIISIVAMVLLIVIVLGVSYAIFTYSQVGTKNNVIKSGSITFAYNETTNGITISNAMPISDTAGKVQTGTGNVFEFTLTNTVVGTSTINYEIYVTNETTATNKLSPDYVKLYLTDITSTETEVVASTIFSQLDDASTNETGKSLYIGSFTSSGTRKFRLRMWLADTYTAAETARTFTMKVNVKATDSSVTSAKTMLIAKANAVETAYTSASTTQQKEMFAFNHTAGTQQAGWSTKELKDYRYIGASPNNYVTFNGESWRIIGAFTVENSDGTKSQKLKIIRNESIGSYSWDSSDSTINSGYGINEWSQADLMTELNSGPYWNRTSGTCYYGSNNSTTTCDFTTTGLNATAKTQISSSKYYLGGKNGYDTASNFYGYERGTTVGTPGTGDTVTRTTNWQGNIGLMYPSDYGYATSGGATTNQATCLATSMYSWSSSYSDCKNNDWLFNSSYNQWTLSPSAGNATYVFYVDTSGHPYNFTNNNPAYNSYSVRLVAYLRSDIRITSGDGSSSNPYIIE